MNWMKHAPIFYEKISNNLELIVLIEGFHAYACVYIYIPPEVYIIHTSPTSFTH